jgi:type II secretory pathway pseudopilin PulG
MSDYFVYNSLLILVREMVQGVPAQMQLNLLKREKGISLLETIVGLAIFGIVGVCFLSGLTNSFMSEKIHRQQATAQTIASSGIEYVKSQPFSDTPWSYMVSSSSRSSDQSPSWWGETQPPLLDGDYHNYMLTVSAQDFDKDNDGTIEVPGDDDGVRKVTASVYDYSGKMILSCEAYKAIRVSSGAGS